MNRASARTAGLPEADAAKNFELAQDQSLRLAGLEFMSVFDLAKEDATRRAGYGGEFGQRCLLARRLAERGVRFIEVAHNLNFVNGTGWDTHQKGQLQQHLLIQELDQALSALLLDLERVKLLHKTLVVVSTEFGRVPDLFATIYNTLGVAPDRMLHDGDRPVPITDNGQAVRALFS